MTRGRTDTVGDAEPFPLDRIPLPETRRGTRAERRRQRRRRRRIRNVGIATAVVLVVGVVAAVLRPGPDGGEAGDGPGDGVTAPAPAPAVLVAHQDPGGRAASLTVLVPASAGGGTLLLIPPGTMTEVVSLGLEPVSRSLELGGPSRLEATVENLLGAVVGETVLVDDAALAALVQPVGPLTVTVPERVEQVEPSGRVQVLYEAGPVTVAPADVAAFLSARGRGNDLSRLARHQAFFDAWLAAVRARPDAAPTNPPALARAFDALAAGDVRTRVLPVEAFGTGATEGELYRVRADELARMVQEAFPAAALPDGGDRPRVQILNGTGAVGLADAVRARLGAGFDVRLTGNAASFDHESTEIVFYDRGEQEAAQRVRRALGVGDLVFSRNALDVVDVTIIVGKDFVSE
ncbi:MAG: LCP family protein [Acidimicrobiia bacterium]